MRKKEEGKKGRKKEKQVESKEKKKIIIRKLKRKNSQKILVFFHIFLGEKITKLISLSCCSFRTGVVLNWSRITIKRI